MQIAYILEPAVFIETNKRIIIGLTLSDLGKCNVSSDQ